MTKQADTTGAGAVGSPLDGGVRRLAVMGEPYGDAYPGERGNTRAPKFGEWLRGVWATARNPHRDGMYVRTIRRTGRATNPGTWYELTDGKGKFWQYQAKDTVFVTPNA